jgi:hypothetical protein
VRRSSVYSLPARARLRRPSISASAREEKYQLVGPRVDESKRWPTGRIRGRCQTEEGLMSTQTERGSNLASSSALPE